MITENEKSLLFYLLDAIRISPNKYKKLVSIIDLSERSQDFVNIINEINSADDINKIILMIRQRLI